MSVVLGPVMSGGGCRWIEAVDLDAEGGREGRDGR